MPFLKGSTVHSKHLPQNMCMYYKWFTATISTLLTDQSFNISCKFYNFGHKGVSGVVLFRVEVYDQTHKEDKK